MKIRTLLTALAVTFTFAAFAQPASAYTSYIKVTGHYAAVNLCRPAPDQLRYNLQFWATFKRKHSPKPRAVLIKYATTDATTGATLVSGKVTLNKANGYRKDGATFTVAAGESLLYQLNLSYRAPVSGHTVKANTTDSDQVPTADQMDQANAQNPSNPPFPNC